MANRAHAVSLPAGFIDGVTHGFTINGQALIWHFILFDLLNWVTVNFFSHVTELPELSGTEALVTVLLSLLGLGAMRTAQKFGGKAR